MRWKTSNATFGFKMDHKFGFTVPKNIYPRKIRPLNCILRTFYGVFRDSITAHAQKHHQFYVRFQNGPQNRIHRAEKHVYTENYALKLHFTGIFRRFS